VGVDEQRAAGAEPGGEEPGPAGGQVPVDDPLEGVLDGHAPCLAAFAEDVDASFTVRAGHRAHLKGEELRGPQSGQEQRREHGEVPFGQGLRALLLG